MKVNNISPLPWEEKLSKNRNKYIIYDKNNNIVIDNVRQLGDALFIQDSCNNIYQAIELLKRSSFHLKENSTSKVLNNYF